MARSAGDYYKVDKDGNVERDKRTCPRCEKGTFMAEHYDRYSCGRCGYTEFKRDKSD